MAAELTSNTASWPAEYRPHALTFRERRQCILCGGGKLRSLWSGQFGDEPVMSWLQAFRYEVEVDDVLAREWFHRVRCLDCGITFHRFVLDEAGAAALYGEWISRAQIDAFESVHRGSTPAAVFEGGVQAMKHLLRLARLCDNRSRTRPVALLDFGSGDGRFVAAARLLGFEANGVDPSPTRQGQAERGGLSLLDSLAVWDGLGREPLDAVTLFEVLEHVAEPLDLLVDLGRRLRPGGVLIVEVPDCRGIAAAPRTLEEFHRVQPLEHPNHFTPATLRAMCRRAGYLPIAKPPAHVTTAPLAILRTEVSRVVRPSTTSQYFVRA
ncbi:MAG: class I SAM-dependent methyltransferase [Acidobacteriota bacterium]